VINEVLEIVKSFLKNKRHCNISSVDVREDYVDLPLHLSLEYMYKTLFDYSLFGACPISISLPKTRDPMYFPPIESHEKILAFLYSHMWLFNKLVLNLF
jgi:hypothetical protein